VSTSSELSLTLGSFKSANKSFVLERVNAVDSTLELDVLSNLAYVFNRLLSSLLNAVKSPGLKSFPLSLFIEVTSPCSLSCACNPNSFATASVKVF